MPFVKGIIHKFLSYAPVGVPGVVIAAAGVWDGLRDKIAVAVADAINAMSNPIVAVLTGIFICAWIAGIFFTNDGGEKAAEARANAKAQKARARTHIVAVGRALANGFRKSNEHITLKAFMENDGGYSRIRPHFSQKFKAKLDVDDPSKPVMVEALMDEMDRLERKWKLV